MADATVYLQPGAMVFEALLDLMELQKGDEVESDPSGGKHHFETTLYGVVWGIRFTIMEIDRTRCAVSVEVASKDGNGDTEGFAEIMALREYALLDSMLLIGTPYEIS